MKRSTLDLRLSVFAGPTPKTGPPMLLGHIRSHDDGPTGHSSEFLVLCRDESGLPPPWISRSRVTDQDVVRLKKLVCAAGFPRRVPRVVASKGPRDGARNCIALDIRLAGRGASWNLLSEGAGFSGDDAGPIRALLQLLGELADAGGRPAFRAVVNSLVVDSHADTERGRIEPPPALAKSAQGSPAVRPMGKWRKMVSKKMASVYRSRARRTGANHVPIHLGSVSSGGGPIS